MIKENIQSSIRASIEAKTRLLADETMLEKITSATETIIRCYQNKGKVLLCGNGGSAADAQHLAAELSGRFYFDRPPLYAEALHVNTSFVTAVANDYHYDNIYARMLQAAGCKGDVLIGLSTSGNSPNVLNAITVAREIGMTVIGLTGEKGGKMKEVCHILLNVPSDDTPRIQEMHITVGHAICEMVEAELFDNHSKTDNDGR